MKRKYGWKRQLPDHRDLKYSLSGVAGVVLPRLIDLRPNCPMVYDQGPLGSRIANAIAAAFEFDNMKQGLLDFRPSRLQIYYNARAAEGTIKSDSGAAIRDGFKVINSLGVCHEKLWPYDVRKFSQQPPTLCSDEGRTKKSLEYKSLACDLLEIREALAAEFPVVFGFTVYESFESTLNASTGTMVMPGKTERPLGGHAVMAVGYDDDRQVLIVRNSWGSLWGDKGNFYMPYDYVRNDLTADFWTLTLVA